MSLRCRHCATSRAALNLDFGCGASGSDGGAGGAVSRSRTICVNAADAGGCCCCGGGAAATAPSAFLGAGFLLALRKPGLSADGAALAAAPPRSAASARASSSSSSSSRA